MGTTQDVRGAIGAIGKEWAPLVERMCDELDASRELLESIEHYAQEPEPLRPDADAWEHGYWAATRDARVILRKMLRKSAPTEAGEQR